MFPNGQKINANSSYADTGVAGKVPDVGSVPRLVVDAPETRLASEQLAGVNLSAADLNGGPLPELVATQESEAFWEAEYRQHVVVRALQVMQTDFEPQTWQACWELVTA